MHRIENVKFFCKHVGQIPRLGGGLMEMWHFGICKRQLWKFKQKGNKMGNTRGGKYMLTENVLRATELT